MIFIRPHLAFLVHDNSVLYLDEFTDRLHLLKPEGNNLTGIHNPSMVSENATISLANAMCERMAVRMLIAT